MKDANGLHERGILQEVRQLEVLAKYQIPNTKY
jgi:hypothetical protein